MKIKTCSELRTLRTLSLSKWSKCRTIFFTIIAICFMQFRASAQTTSVRIIDFLVLPAYHTDTIAQNDTVALTVMFKTKNAAQANKAMLLFGTSNDAGDVKLIQANFTTVNDTTFIAYNGLSEPILNYATNITIMLPRLQYDAFTHATLYVEDSNSLQTQHLYFQKH